MSDPKRPRNEPTRLADIPAQTADTSVRTAVYEAAAGADWITPVDRGTLQLALKLADDIDKRLDTDSAVGIAHLSRTLLMALEKLGLTVSARREPTVVTQPEDPLDVLRAKAAARLNDAAGGDPSNVRALTRR